MKLSDFYNTVARQADTEKTAINAAETKRVLSVAFTVLSEMSIVDATEVIAKGLSTAHKKKKKAAKSAKKT
jgi:hypothetical protein